MSENIKLYVYNEVNDNPILQKHTDTVTKQVPLSS